MKNLDSRKEEILVSIVESYVESASPVGSRVLAKSCRLDYSPSTIRNEMFDLEEMGYLTHPHTSSGRIPTDRGYRYFVDRFAEQETLNKAALEALFETYKKRIRNAEELLERTLHILSALSHQASFIFVPEDEGFVVKNVNLMRLEGNFIMAFWLSHAGLTKSCMVDMGEHLSDEDLMRLGHFLNAELSGLSHEDIKEFVARKLAVCRDSLKHLYEKASRIIEEAILENVEEKIYLDGQGRMLEQPEFQLPEHARPVITALEERKTIQKLLREKMQSQGVSVHIGSETRVPFLQDCSLIAMPCFQRSRKIGIVGILGPRRMRYGQMMSLVANVSRLAGENFERWFE
jgi:heat-inducible transcriptional repressor